MPEFEFHFSDGTPDGSLPVTENNFSRLPFVSYQEHLRRYALVVHHGGAGIMYHTLAAGRPAVVFPVDYDQFDNAARLEHAGLALRLRHRRELGKTVMAAMGDRGLLDRCARFARGQMVDVSSRLLDEVGALLRPAQDSILQFGL
jgi:UDP:flavonoid glycosyltransferase YjiC (YdhE family)